MKNSQIQITPSQITNHVHSSVTKIQQIILPFLLTSLLSSLSTPRPRMSISLDSYKKIRDLMFGAQWTTPALKGTISLAWVLSLSHLEGEAKGAALGDVEKDARMWMDKFRNDGVFELMRDLVEGNISGACNDGLKAIMVFAIKTQGGEFSTFETQDDIDSDFKIIIRNCIEQLLVQFVRCFRRHFREMIAVDQDLIHSNSVDQENSRVSITHPLTRTESLLNLIITVYDSQIDYAVEWWTGDLFLFVKMCAGFWTPKLISLFIRSLAILSSGPQCAARAHSLLSLESNPQLGAIQWSTLFRTLRSYTERNGYNMTTNEENLIVSFLKLMAAIVQHSYTARRTLIENQHFVALNTLFSLLVSSTPLSIKAALVSTLASFVPGFETSVWLMLEESRMIPTRTGGGIRGDMEVENLSGEYPLSTAIVTLLSALVLSDMDTLGAPERLGGTGVYISFMLDEILLASHNYRNESDRWDIESKCFKVIEEVLDRINAESLVLHISSGGGMERLVSFSNTPGFGIMTRLLQRSSLLELIFVRIKDLGPTTHGALRIMSRALSIQKSIVDVIAPCIAQEGGPNFTLQSIEELMVYDSDVIVALGVYISHQKICIEALGILKAVSITAPFGPGTGFGACNRLVSLWRHSKQSNVIIAAFVDRIEMDTTEDGGEKHEILLNIMDFLIVNLAVPGPNMVHYLLGLEPARERKLLDAIIALVNGTEMFKTHPLLAEKIHHLISMLAFQESTSSLILHHLRQQNFLYLSLATFQTVDDKGEDNFKPSHIARMYTCAWLLDTVCVELHTTVLSGQRSQSARLIELLFGTPAISGQFEQPLMKSIDLLRSLNFKESVRGPIDISSTPFSNLSLSEFIMEDERQTKIFDLKNLHLALASIFQSLEMEDAFSVPGARNEAEECLENIIQYAADANHRQEISKARFYCLLSWCSLIRDTLSGYFDLHAREFRESLIFKLLSTLLFQVNIPDVLPSIGTCVSETVLALISRLDQDRQYRLLFEKEYGQERLEHHVILKGILDGIVGNRSSAAMRGDYYAALITFISYIKPDLDSSSDSFLKTISAIKDYGDRILELMCADACEGEFVWQTIAFAALGCLVEISNHSIGDSVLMFLQKKNYLCDFVRTLKHKDDAILLHIFDGHGTSIFI